jgi:hypothetical protein
MSMKMPALSMANLRKAQQMTANPEKALKDAAAKAA